MKTKHTIYFMLVVIGAVVMAVGDEYVDKEYALSIGIVLLMFGIYKSSKVWNNGKPENDTDKPENTRDS